MDASFKMKENPPRSEVPEEYTWNAPSLFASVAGWEAEYQAVSQAIPGLSAYQGRLGDSAEALLEALKAREELFRRTAVIELYAGLQQAVDAADQAAAGRELRARSLFGQMLEAQAFYDPELIAAGQATLEAWMQASPDLKVYAQYFANLFRKAPHVRSAEVESLLGALAEPFAGPSAIWRMLTNADFKFPPARDSQGGERPLTQGSLLKYLGSPDRQLRRSANENYADMYLAYQNSLSSTLTASINQFIFKTRARSHKSSLEAALFENNIPTAVFHNLIETFRKNLPTWRRYWEIRRKMLGLEALHHYDIWAPLTSKSAHIPYPQAVEMICAGLAPLGEEYVQVLRDGCLKQRWVDFHPNQGKGGGAFSSGHYGTYPFIVMSYNEDVFSLSTLAHELGHSMHSYLTWQNQPYIYGDYSLFVAETASNFHQAMVRGHLLTTETDPNFQINLVEEAMSNFYRYFLVMPTLARFELELHERAERGEALTAGQMNALLAGLLSEAYGPAVVVDPQRDGIDWAAFPHLYEDFYVYQYATGISAANALARRILSGAPNAAQDYLEFLKAGSSVYPLEALKIAGVDLTSPEPVEAAFAVLSGLVDRLEALAG